MEEKLTLVILAGGLSKRMGRDKADIMFRGKTFLQTQIEKGKMLGVQEIIVSGYRGEKCSEKIVCDRILRRGPLGGMEASFREVRTRRCLVLSVDVPLIPVTELEALIKASGQSDLPITILQHEENEEPLIGVYDANLADVMVEEIIQRKGSVFDFLQRVGYDTYQAKAESSYFENVNTMEMLEKIHKR